MVSLVIVVIEKFCVHIKWKGENLSINKIDIGD